MNVAETIKVLRLYVWQCLVRAFWGSLSSALNWASIIGVGILLWLGFSIETHTWRDVVQWGVITTITAWLIIFLTRLLFVAPFQTFRETDAQRQKLKRKLDDRELRQRTLNQIWDLREEGVRIRNEFPVNFPVWHRRCEEWRESVLDATGVLSVNLRRHLQTLNETHGYPTDIQIVGGVHDGEHKLDLSVISEMLRRLEKYLERDL